MKGYKAMNEDMTCRGFRYELGKTYEIDGDIKLCEKGFHFCRDIANVFHYYERLTSRVFEVEADGSIDEDPIGQKLCCQKIRIVREVKGIELNRVIYGDGDGSGYGDGYGSGYGSGDGYGDGYGKNIQKILEFMEV